MRLFALARTSLFYLVVAVLVVVASIPVILSSALPYRFRWPLAYGWARCTLWSLRAICGLHYEVHGRNNLPTGPAIAYCKHQSAWETIAMIATCPPHTWVLKRELLWTPFLGWALAAMRAVAIDRGSGRQAVMQVLEQGRVALSEGRWMMIFPEGTRLAPYTTRRYGVSGALLAKDTGMPIVPIAHNAGHYWPRQGLIHPGVVKVVIGRPIDPSGKTPEQINTEAQAWIEAQMAVIEPPPGA